jgi:hypothetical protein
VSSACALDDLSVQAHDLVGSPRREHLEERTIVALAGADDVEGFADASATVQDGARRCVAHREF